MSWADDEGISAYSAWDKKLIKENIMQKTITITGVESTEQKITLLFNKEKYTIWIKDQTTGQPSEPYQQFQKIRPIAGDNLTIEVWESPDTFVNPKGETINYTKRYINKFILDGEGNPSIAPQTHQEAPQPTQQPREVQLASAGGLEALSAKIAVSFKKRDDAIMELSTKLLEMEKQLSYFAFMFQQGNPDAFKTHSDMLPKPVEPKPFIAEVE